MAEQALSRSDRSLEWDKALAVHFNDPNARILMVNAGKDLVLYVTAEQKPLQTTVHAALLVSPLPGSGNTNQAAMSELTGGLVMHVTAGKDFGDPVRVDDWGPRQGTRTLSELISIGPGATHHPEIPPVEPCQGPYATADPCAAEVEALQKAQRTLRNAKFNLWGGLSGDVAMTSFAGGAAWVVGNGIECGSFGNSPAPTCTGVSVTDVTTAVGIAGNAAKAYLESLPKFDAVNDAKNAVDEAQKALDKCRDDNNPPPGDQCPFPKPSPEDLKPTEPYMPENWYGSTSIDWDRIGLILGVGAIAAAIAFSGGTLGLTLAGASAAGIIALPGGTPPGGILFSFPGPTELSDSLVPGGLFIEPALPPLEIVSRDPAPLVFE